MSINVGISKRPIAGGGSKYFPTGLVYSNISDEGLVQYMCQNSQISETAARSAISSFKYAFLTFLINGHTLVVPAMGTYSLSAQCKAQADVESAEKIIQNIRVRFTPTSVVRRAAKSAKFQMIPLQDD